MNLGGRYSTWCVTPFQTGFCLALGLTMLTATLPTDAGDSMIPALQWTPRSDWIDVTRDVTPAARGDGVADDTKAIQAGLNRLRDGDTLFLPPGTYRITNTLVVNGPRVGILIAGCGRNTRIVWDGPDGGVMFWSNGVAYSRYVGIVWDGRNKAAVAVDHAARKRFETEVQHRNEAFLRCTQFGIRIGWKQKIASAEILYRNCLFEECGVGVGFLSFNDYDNTFDRCEFRRCGTGIMDRHGNFYARNCRFIESRKADFDILSEHGDSIRRCVSVGSRLFLRCRSIVAPMVIEACRIRGWSSPDGAVELHCAPVLMFDCVFEQPKPGAGPPVRIRRPDQVLLLSNVAGPSGPVRPKTLKQTRVYRLPDGTVHNTPPEADADVLDQRPWRDGPLFDARRNFGAKGDGKADDTAAIQAAIEAAVKHGGAATAYIPRGRYLVRRTLRIPGPSCRIEGGGSGFRTALIWGGPENAPILHVPEGGRVVVANLAIGHSDLSRSPRSADILVTGAPRPLHLLLDYVFVFGMYQKTPNRGGLVLDGLDADDTVLIEHLQGNLRIRNSGRARILARTSYEGTITLEGPSVGDEQTFPGFLTRLTTIADPTLVVRDNASVVMSDWYVEQALSHIRASGGRSKSPGRIILQQHKIQMNSEGPLMTVDGFNGLVAFAPAQFYCKPPNMVFSGAPGPSFALLIGGAFFYRSTPVVRFEPAAPVYFVGNHGVADKVPQEASRLLVEVLDALRRLGRLDRALPAPVLP